MFMAMAAGVGRGARGLGCTKGERERERETQKKSCGFRGCVACTAKVCWHRLRLHQECNKNALQYVMSVHQALAWIGVAN